VNDAVGIGITGGGRGPSSFAVARVGLRARGFALFVGRRALEVTAPLDDFATNTFTFFDFFFAAIAPPSLYNDWHVDYTLGILDFL
jgi:hypothetical protein